MGCIFEGGEEVTYRPSLTDEQMAVQKALAEWFGTRYGSMATPWEGPLTAPIPPGYEEASNIYRQMAGLGPSTYMEQPMTGYHTTFPGWDIDKPVREAWGITDGENGDDDNGGRRRINGDDNGGGGGDGNGKDDPRKKMMQAQSLVSDPMLASYYAQRQRPNPRKPWTA